MEYRTLIVVDGANNLIECHLNLTDYSLRHGNESAMEKFVDLQLEDHENRRLEIVIQDILRSRRTNLFGDMITSRYSQKGIMATVIPDAPLQPETVVTGTTWEHNTLAFQFGRRPASEGQLNAGDIPILSCPFVTALRKIDDMTAAEKQKVLEVIDMQNRVPFRYPQGDVGFDFVSRRPSSKELISHSLIAESARVPDSPLSAGWSTAAKHERSKLTVSINGENEGCVYGNGGLTCPRPKKRSQIYCGHHLRLVSHKHQTNRALKRSRSSVEFDADQDPDYAGLE